MTTQRQARDAGLKLEMATLARQRRMLSNPPNAPRRNLGPSASAARMRSGSPGRLDDRTRRQLYDGTKRRNIPGRSRTGKVEWLPRWVSSWT
jgi:hypothetical protein